MFRAPGPELFGAQFFQSLSVFKHLCFHLLQCFRYLVKPLGFLVSPSGEGRGGGGEEEKEGKGKCRVRFE